MKGQLFLDSLRILISTFQAQSIKLITTSSPLSHKLQDLSLNLLTLKSSLLKSINSILKSSMDTPNSQSPLLQTLQKQQEQCCKKLKKLQLHAFLKKKIKKMQRESIMNSVVEQSFQGSVVEDPCLVKLRNSMVLIQKDLGIQDDVITGGNDGDVVGGDWVGDVSAVVHRSMASLQMTPIRTDRSVLSDTSMRMDDSYVLPYNNAIKQQPSPSTSTSTKQPQQNPTQQPLPKPQPPSTTLKQPQPPQPQPQPQPTTTTTITNKKKRTNGLNATGSKMGMFDNLIEESLNVCFQGKDKT